MVIEMERKSGVLMHISSLPGKYSIGSFGEEAKRFVDFLYDCGFGVWQVLPFGAVDEYNSPYRPDSAKSVNPYFIDLETIFGKGLISKTELDAARQRVSDRCEFDFLRKNRVKLLRKAAKRAGTENFIFTEFLSQWADIKNYANEKEIKIIGDLPFYMAPDSRDVKNNPELFVRDEVAGVPPDYFNENGQLWGNPLYSWNEMKKDGYRWWYNRVRFAAKMFDGIRIDHFRAIESAWAVPKDAETAKKGRWIKGPGMELVDVIKKAAGETFVIAEDLGDITPEVQKLVNMSGFPGMRVFQFGFMAEKDSPHRPENYPEICVAYTGTHDNNTLRGFLPESVSVREVIEQMLESKAALVIFPVQDLLGLGEDARMNFPGRAEGNWQFRVTSEQLDRIDRQYYKEINKRYSR